jgi:methionyl-tRNA formyltransferase
VTHPYPGAFSFLEGRKVIVWQAWPLEGSGLPGQIVSHSPLVVATGRGLLEIRSLQVEGEQEYSAADFVDNHSDHITSFQENS